MNGFKITVMGEEIDPATIPEPVPDFEFYFAQPVLSGESLNKCAEMVPEQYWKPHGIHTWLSRRAKDAWERCSTMDQLEVEMGRLRYIFERGTGNAPTLKTLILLP